MPTIPRCPECDELLTATLQACRNCGWCAAPAPTAPTATARPPTPTRPDAGVPISRERRVARMAELWAILKRPPPERRIVHDAPDASPEFTPGHGARCTCEICFPIRIAHARRPVRQRDPGDDDEACA